MQYNNKTIEYSCLMVNNSTFNNISPISWQSVLLLQETRGPGENYRPVASHWQTFSNNVVHLTLIEIREITTSVMIRTDCIGHDAPSLQYRILQMR